MKWYLMAFKKYAKFSGRSRRREYWYFVLFNFLVSFFLGFMDGIFMAARGMTEGTPPIGPLSGFYILIMLIPGIALATRRLHDIGKSGWWQLIILVPLLGALVLIYFYLKNSEAGENRFGPSPKEPIPEALPA